jgi:large subunit ribosomal protein L23
MALFKNKKKKTEEQQKPKASKQEVSSGSSEKQEKKVQASPAKVRAYEIIKSPHVTEKSTELGQKNKYVFKIYPYANKVEVRKAIEALYNVKVADVNIVHTPPKRRRLGRQEGWQGGLKQGYKKAIVTLKPGDKIEIIPGS